MHTMGQSLPGNMADFMGKERRTPSWWAPACAVVESAVRKWTNGLIGVNPPRDNGLAMRYRHLSQRYPLDVGEFPKLKRFRVWVQPG